MMIQGISDNINGMPQGQAGIGVQNDAVSKSIQKQIASVQQKMQELSSDDNLSMEDKMKKRQEYQQEIANLNQQLRQRQIELRKEQQEKASSTDNSMNSISKNKVETANGNSGLSIESMESMVAAGQSMKQAQVQGSVVQRMESKANVLENEIKTDSARGIGTTRKEESLADIMERMQSSAQAQMSSLKQANDDAQADEEVKEKENDTWGRGKCIENDKNDTLAPSPCIKKNEQGLE